MAPYTTGIYGGQAPWNSSVNFGAGTQGQEQPQGGGMGGGGGGALGMALGGQGMNPLLGSMNQGLMKQMMSNILKKQAMAPAQNLAAGIAPL